jgi:hypothetical protein
LKNFLEKGKNDKVIINKKETAKNKKRKRKRKKERKKRI